MFAEPGEHRIVLQIRQDSHNPGNSATSTCPYTIHVGSPPDPLNEYPYYSADPRPPDDPDENPWPVAPAPVEIPPIPPLPELPIGPGPGLPSPTLLDPPGGGGFIVQPQTGPAGLVVEAPRALKTRALLRRGMLVRVTSGRALKVRLRLSAKGRSYTGAVSVRVPERRAVIARLLPSRAGRSLLRRAHVRTLKLEALAGPGTRVVQRVRLR